MNKTFILTICLFTFCEVSIAQSKNPVYDEPVNIDSLLKSPILLPQGKHYMVKTIAFSLPIDKIIDVGKTGGIFRDRFMQLNALLPDQHWEYRFGCVTLEVGDNKLSLVFGNRDQLDKMLKLEKVKEHDTTDITFKTKMLIGKFKQYDTTRDFQVVDIQMTDK